MIAVDWGTSSVRAWRLDAGGAMREQRAMAADLLACRGRFEALLGELLAGWDELTVLMAGMIGSRNGWCEVPYVACPAGVEEIAAGLSAVPVGALTGRRVFIAPGLAWRRAAGEPPEVMRGEETQLLGLMDELPADAAHTVCLPGTHSKWARVEGGRIVAFRTAMTGELYALLRRHSLLAGLMPPLSQGDVDDGTAFEAGVAASAREGGLTHHLFGVRTLGLFGALEGAPAPSYLSGLLIGHELRALRGDASEVHVLGAPALCRRYERALQALGACAHLHDEAATARGLYRLARVRRQLD